MHGPDIVSVFQTFEEVHMIRVFPCLPHLATCWIKHCSGVEIIGGKKTKFHQLCSSQISSNSDQPPVECKQEEQSPLGSPTEVRDLRTNLNSYFQKPLCVVLLARVPFSVQIAVTLLVTGRTSGNDAIGNWLHQHLWSQKLSKGSSQEPP